MYVASPQHIAYGDGQQEEIPVVQRLCEEDATQIMLVFKLAKDSRGSPSHGIGEVGGIHQVDGEGHHIDDDEIPLTDLMPQRRFLQMQGEEHHHEVGDMCHEDGRGVEDQRTFDEVEGNRPCKERPIFHHKGDACYQIDAVCQQQVCQHGHQGRYV